MGERRLITASRRVRANASVSRLWYPTGEVLAAENVKLRRLSRQGMGVTSPEIAAAATESRLDEIWEAQITGGWEKDGTRQTR
ncbi:Protein of unknown function [Pyronema omphalodes CBS 100304]|uniref:Uncharacterized protein n=1 Tax=Pyronema omphalodes (strain CBS 100304) TaxID=1076935 RepID=U4LBP2_PYROM|nr:Protein of unknown function [Pyronema omphalodes CBS 100304]